MTRATSAALALLALFLLPARHATLRGDDVFTLQKHGLVELQGDSFLGYLADAIWRSVEQGRPQVLGGIQSELFIWVLEGHATLYRVVLVAIMVAAGYLLFRLATELGVPRPAALLTIVLLAGAIQFRSYHDAMLGYYGTTQLTIVLILGSLLLFVRALRGDGTMAWPIVLFVGACLMYEWAYALAAAHLAIALMERRGREALRAARPYLLTAFVFVLGAFLARRVFAENVPTGYTVSTSVMGILRTYVVQLFPPIPGSNLVLEDNAFRFFALPGDPTSAELLGALWRGTVVAAAVWFAARRSALPEPATLRRLAAAGAALWLAPPLFVSASAKYHVELTAAKGYLPTLLQSFGWALAATAALFALLRLAAGRSTAATQVTAAVAALALGLAAGVAGFNNLRVVAQEVPVAKTRELLEDAAEEGVFDGLARETSLLFSERDMQWPTGNISGAFAMEALLAGHTEGPLLDAREPAPEETFSCPRGDGVQPADCAPLGPAAAWVRVRARRAGGSVVLAFIDDRERPVEASATRLRVAVEGAGQPPRLTGQTAAGTPWTSENVPWDRMEAGGGWSIHEAALSGDDAPVASTVDDPAGVVDFSALGTPGQIVRIYGTKRLLP